MEHYKQLAQYVLDRLKDEGADDAQCHMINQTYTELNVENNEFSLMRTYSDIKVAMKALSCLKPGTATAARLSKDSLDEAIEQCIASMHAAQPDEYEGMAEPEGGCTSFTKGELEPDSDGMLTRVVEYVEDKNKKDPDETIDQFIMSHVRVDQVFLNTRGVNLDSKNGYYALGVRGGSLFTPNLKNRLITVGEVIPPYDEALRKEPVKPLDARFEGTVIFHPRYHRLFWWLSSFCVFNENSMLGTDGHPKNKWADSLGEQVTSECLSLSFRPLDERVCNASPFTKDGYLSRNVDVIKNGIFSEMRLSAKAARKTGRPRNSGPFGHEEDDLKCNIFVEPGQESIRDIIKGVKKGLIIFTLPGAMPGDVTDGDFAGIVRSGLLIENGEVTRPISEVMVSHNYYEMLKSIRAVSSEYYYSGGDITPWIAFDGFTIQ